MRKINLGTVFIIKGESTGNNPVLFCINRKNKQPIFTWASARIKEMSSENEKFDLEIEHEAEAFTFPAELRPSGYTYKIAVEIFGSEVLFEPDEERNFRAVIDRKEYPSINLDAHLLQKIAKFLEEAFK